MASLLDMLTIKKLFVILMKYRLTTFFHTNILFVRLNFQPVATEITKNKMPTKM